MIINKKSVGFRKFSTKVIGVTIVIFCVVLPLLIGLLTYRETIFLKEYYLRRGQDMIAGVREASRIALLAEDKGRLASIAREYMMHRQEILYIMFYNNDWDQIYASAADAQYRSLLENAGREFQREFSATKAKWRDNIIIRNIFSGEKTHPVSEFWTRVSSREVGDLEMLSDSSERLSPTGAEKVSGYICLGVSRAELRGIIGRITMDAMIAGLLALVTMSIATAWLLQRLMAPFSELVKGVQAVAEGDMDRTISIKSKDEVSSLADEFNKMVVALNEWQKKLLESENKFRSLFKRIHSGILIFGLDGEILDSNPAMTEIVGYDDVASLTGVPMESFFKNREDYELLLRRVRDERDFRDMQLVLKNRKTGLDVETNVSVTCQMDADDNYEYSEAAFVDITHITELEKLLLHAHKMEAIGTLAGGIAHDFNNILTVISGHIGLMELSPEVKTNKKLQDNLESIEQSVVRATELVSQIMGFARKGMYKEVVLHLNKVAVDVHALLVETIDRRIQLKLELDTEIRPIKGDTGQLFQSLLNICLNSCDAMPEGGLMTISTGSLVNEQDITLADKVMPPGEYVFLRVEDTGVGMDETTVGKIFDPFFTTKGVGKGTGLGMAMVHGIISNHGGYIHVESRKSLGTTVTLYFPAFLQESLEGGSQPGREQEPGTAGAPTFSAESRERSSLHADQVESRQEDRGRESGAAVSTTVEPSHETTGPPDKREKITTILLVDDEKGILGVNKAFFSSLDDYRLLTAASGEESIEIVKENRAAIDFVVMDISMPGMGGEKAFKVIHELYPDLPVIIATGYAQDEVVNRMLNEGACDLILKPYLGTDLIEVLHKNS